MPTIMAGITQCIMLSLSMVVIAALVGAGGLGKPVVRALNPVKVAHGVRGRASPSCSSPSCSTASARPAETAAPAMTAALRVPRRRHRLRLRQHRHRRRQHEQALRLLADGVTRNDDRRAHRRTWWASPTPASGRAGRDLRADGPLGLRQIDPAARGQRAQHGDARQRAGRRTAGRRSTSPPATPTTLAARAQPAGRHGVPAVRAAALAHGARECRARPGTARHARGRARRRIVDEKLHLVGLDAVGATTMRTSSRAACSSASGSRARSPPTPTSCSWTSRSRPSTR